MDQDFRGSGSHGFRISYSSRMYETAKILDISWGKECLIEMGDGGGKAFTVLYFYKSTSSQLTTHMISDLILWSLQWINSIS